MWNDEMAGDGECKFYIVLHIYFLPRKAVLLEISFPPSVHPFGGIYSNSP